MKRRITNTLIGATIGALVGLSGLSATALADDTPIGIKPVLSKTPPMHRGMDQECSGDPMNLFYPLDGSFVLVDFFGDGCTGSGCAQGPDQHNDDDSAFVSLPFTFDLYGDLYDECFINNNGNVTFLTLFSSFVPVGFPDPSIPPMIAPFWGDVDTGNPNNFIGDVWMKFLDSNGDTFDDTMVVIWDNVGYYDEHGDLLNTFELIMTDGTNPDIGFDRNVCFVYDDMCWTTGDASGGSGGFGGTPATVGANRGNGVEFFQVGRFDHPGNDYDGPFGNNDGVSFLDFQSICFQTGTQTINIDPIAVGFPDEGQVTLDACVPEVLDLVLQFLSPEEDQVTTVDIVDVNDAQGAGLMISNTPGNPAIITLDWMPDAGDAGSYILDFTATDDFDPPGVTEMSLTINILNVGCEVETFLDIKPGSCPNPFNRKSRGRLPTAILGTDTFDVTMVDRTSVVLARADGVGGSVGTLDGMAQTGGIEASLGALAESSGDNLLATLMSAARTMHRIEDVATPFEGELCDCHTLGPDGFDDLVLRFSRPELVEVLELDDLPAGAFVELTISGVLMDGTPFDASDCIWLVPPGLAW